MTEWVRHVMETDSGTRESGYSRALIRVWGLPKRSSLFQHLLWLINRSSVWDGAQRAPLIHVRILAGSICTGDRSCYGFMSGRRNSWVLL